MDGSGSVQVLVTEPRSSRRTTTLLNQLYNYHIVWVLVILFFLLSYKLSFKVLLSEIRDLT